MSKNSVREGEWEEEDRSEGNGIYMRVAVRPRVNCLIKDISKTVNITSHVPGYEDGQLDQIIIERSDHSELVERYPVCKIIETSDRIIYRFPDSTVDYGESGCKLSRRSCDTCSNSGCTACEFENLPIHPCELSWKNGQLHMIMALSTQSEFQKSLGVFNNSSVDIDLLQIVHDDWNRTSGTISTLIDRSSLTARQREVTKRAIEMGYFDRQGASADTIATELGISKSTLSKHLRIVTEKILTQVFET